MIPSLPKLIGLAAVIWRVWMAFRMFESRQARGDTTPDNDDRPADPGSVDLVECDICGAWVAGHRCERDNCPY